MRLILQPAPSQYSKESEDTMRQTLVRRLNTAVSNEEAINRVILLDANGKTWAVSITTAGALTVAAISGKTRDV